MSFGVLPTGFAKRTLEDLIAQVAAEEIAQISDNLDTSSSSPLGQINAVLMKVAAELWDLAQAVYDAQDPSKNSADAQDAICEITGTSRLGPTKSSVNITLGLTNGTTVPAGSIVASSGDPTVRFVLVGPEPAPGQPVVPGPVVANAGDGDYDGRFEADVTGPVIANAGTLTVIITPVSGWNAASNALDASPGRNIETDSDLRLRRVAELAAEGTSPVDEIRAELLKLVGMVQANVFENVTDTTDGEGRPPHSIEALVFDGPTPTVADNDIAQTLWESKAGGIQTFGSSSGTAIDSKGDPRTMYFSRPTAKTVYFTIDISTNADYPGDTVLKQALVTHGQELGMGDDVILASFYGTVFGVGGVEDIISFKAGFTASPSGTVNLVIGPRELATFDTSRIVLT